MAGSISVKRGGINKYHATTDDSSNNVKSFVVINVSASSDAWLILTLTLVALPRAPNSV